MTILHQLLSAQPTLIHHALPAYREKGESLCTSFPQLWSIFTAAITDPSTKSIICILDALDECNEEEQSQLIKGLERLFLACQTSSSTSNVKVLVTSRPYFQIRREFDHLLRACEDIELSNTEESSAIKREIDLVIHYRIQELARRNRLAENVSSHLRDRLLKTENRTYLWLRLVWEIIEKDMLGTVAEMNKIIDDLPSGMQDAYKALLQKSPDPLFAQKVLQIVCVAYRPLTVGEMDLALNINEQTTSYKDLDLEGDARLQETLPSRCGLMVSINRSEVYFIHQTVKEFLLSQSRTKLPDSNVKRYSIDLDTAHYYMAKVCLQSLTFLEIRLDKVNVCNALLPLRNRRRPNKYSKQHLFLSYSAMYWADHACDRMDQQSLKIVKHILKSKYSQIVVDCWDEEVGYPLFAASLGGHGQIVQVLLQMGSDVNVQYGLYDTALNAASANGHENIVRVLLSSGADVNARDKFGRTGLYWASKGGHEQIVRLLLDTGQNTNTELPDLDVGLAEAAIKGFESIVRLLVEKGADVNFESNNSNTALLAASGSGHQDIVQFLLSNDADVDAKDLHEEGALHKASALGNEIIVRLLLEYGADVNARNENKETALIRSSFTGHKKVVHLLLKSGADVKAKDEDDHTALVCALYEGHEDIAQILLNNGTPLETQIEKDKALVAASDGGCEAFVRSLLDNGADMTFGNDEGGPAIISAARTGHESIVQLLLSRGADVNARDKIGETALIAAAAEGYEDTIRLLLHHGADINAQNEENTTALESAHYLGNGEDIVHLLRENGAIENDER